ncbi:MAG: tetratricopeptide repeat protein [Treponema sp.]|nr:tetratricopeptide repeat protein [Treponema sp.]
MGLFDKNNDKSVDTKNTQIAGGKIPGSSMDLGSNIDKDFLNNVSGVKNSSSSTSANAYSSSANSTNLGAGTAQNLGNAARQVTLTPASLSNKQKILVSVLGGMLGLGVVAGTSVYGVVKTKKEKDNRESVYTLARTYFERGEYNRALDKLDAYLEENGNDEDAWNLWNEIISVKQQKEKEEKEAMVAAAYENGQGANAGSFTIDVDASSISNVMQDSISSMKDALEQTNKQAEDNRKAMESLIKFQEEQKKAELERKAEEAKAEERKRKLEAEEKKQKEKEAAELAEQKRVAEEKRKVEEEKKKIAEEKRKAEEEKRRAEEEALARKNEKIKKEIENVNEDIQKGKTALATGNLEEAMKYFQKAEEKMPNEAGAEVIANKASEIAQSLFDASEKTDAPDKKKELMEQAISMAEKAVQNDEKDAGAHYILAQDALNKKDYEKALREMKAAVEYDPTNYLYFYNLGKIQYTTRKYSEAASSFTTSCKLNEKFAPSRYNLGLTQKQLKNDTAALDAFRKTIDIDPRHEKAYLEEGKLLSARGDFTGAIEAYNAVLKINNINVQAANLLAGVYYQKKNYSEAEDCYRRALTMLSPSEEMTMTKYNLSSVLFDAGKIHDAEKYAKEAYESEEYVKSKTSKAEITYNYALILDKTGKTDEAIDMYLKVLELNPDHIKTKLNLGNMYLTLDPPDTEMSLALFLQVYQSDSTNVEVNNQLGNVYSLREDFANSIKFFQNALKLDSKNTVIRSSLASAYAKSGDYDNAKTTYTELLKLDRNNLDAYIELAKVCLQLNDNKNAEAYLITVQSKDPGYRKPEVDNLMSGISIPE